ncbi:hypothetical protein PAHAL_6G054700 [Panicum hallii]|uniref:Uncharacterized protein n=1 Tax=Panicum hallii TaxID=206008 RepID=A0A2T8IF88_9POAL|nr:hypothetical protein PAHAL_6G054700 [Panicum hallii]
MTPPGSSRPPTPTASGATATSSSRMDSPSLKAATSARVSMRLRFNLWVPRNRAIASVHRFTRVQRVKAMEARDTGDRNGMRYSGGRGKVEEEPAECLVPAKSSNLGAAVQFPTGSSPHQRELCRFSLDASAMSEAVAVIYNFEVHVVCVGMGLLGLWTLNACFQEP